MNSVGKIFSKSNVTGYLFQQKRTAALWNKDWMPGPYPVTPAQRAAAAKKYNLLPEEYEPYPEGYGDYPKLPMISGDSKDPYYNYDLPAHRKDCGEPLHVWANVISQDRWDCNDDENQQIPRSKQVAACFGVFGGLFLIHFLANKYLQCAFPHMKKHYLSDGPHYKYPKY